ncbi:DUF726 domain-containing protein [Serratia fonticola]|uniref:DUF726 domain-containing protein n=1 Tax=Serratia fonticola TaxID=47917 RepID=UPI002DBA55D2|nr:DUF726 domain-containing protein [Serratia fonticola]MEB7886252.1 DUF726 domain-containing protein [Serratia fonticola]
MSEKEMDTNLSFEFCSDSRGSIVNVFIHGYSAVKSGKDKARLKRYIPERREMSTNIFAFWPSGKVLDGVLAPMNIMKLVTSGPLLSLANLSIEEIKRFKLIESNIKSLVYEFFIKLRDFINKENIIYERLNLYGHSLGARLIIESIIALPDDYKKLNIDNLIFMGGARNLQERDCKALLQVISGEIFNIHSSSDYVLKFIKPDFEKCIGLYPIQPPENLLSRVHNHAFDFLGHMDYWESIGEIIKYLNLDKSSDTYLMPIHSHHEKRSFSVADIPLYIPISYATDTEREILARLLSIRSSSSIVQSERNPTILTNEIQLMGGDSVINKIRGHGVMYSEIVRDAAKEINVIDYQTSGFMYLEKAVLDKILSTLKSEHLSSDEYNRIKITKIMHRLYSYSNDGQYTQSDINDFIQLAELMTNKIIKSFNISGPAYSITIPIVIVMHHIRNRIINEMGVNIFQQPEH